MNYKQLYPFLWKLLFSEQKEISEMYGKDQKKTFPSQIFAEMVLSRFLGGDEISLALWTDILVLGRKTIKE